MSQHAGLDFQRERVLSVSMALLEKERIKKEVCGGFDPWQAVPEDGLELKQGLTVLQCKGDKIGLVSFNMISSSLRCFCNGCDKFPAFGKELTIESGELEGLLTLYDLLQQEKKQK